MAVTKIWTIKDSLQRVLEYAANPDKTEYDALAQTLHYAENDTKTKLNESAQLVTGMRRKDAPSELADRRAMLTCKIAELRKEDKIAEGAIKRIQRTHESNRIDRENQERHTNHNRRRDSSRQR